MPAFTVTERGIGKPDYSQAVSSAVERRGIRLQYGQTGIIFGLVFDPATSLIPTVVTPLASGASLHLINASTGLSMPYTVPEGYTGSLITAGYATSADVAMRTYYDTQLMMTGIIEAGVFYENRVVGISTALFDPTADDAHLLDVTAENLGSVDLLGGVEFVCILEAVGTEPLPTVKLIRCKNCGNEETVPVETTQWICPECESLNLFYNTSTLGKG